MRISFGFRGEDLTCGKAHVPRGQSTLLVSSPVGLLLVCTLHGGSCWTGCLSVISLFCGVCCPQRRAPDFEFLTWERRRAFLVCGYYMLVMVHSTLRRLLVPKYHQPTVFRTLPRWPWPTWAQWNVDASGQGNEGANTWFIGVSAHSTWSILGESKLGSPLARQEEPSASYARP